MSDKFKQKCPKCGEEIDIEWNNGAILPKGACLIADWVFHEKCFDDDYAEYEAGEHQGVIGAIEGKNDDDFDF